MHTHTHTHTLKDKVPRPRQTTKTTYTNYTLYYIYISRLNDRNRYLFFTTNEWTKKKNKFSIKFYNCAIALIDEKKRKQLTSAAIQAQYSVSTHKIPVYKIQAITASRKKATKRKKEEWTANEVRQHSNDRETERSKHLVLASKMDWPTRTYYTHAHHKICIKISFSMKRYKNSYTHKKNAKALCIFDRTNKREKRDRKFT